MRIDRIDVQPTGSALQLHPRMTVLAAATSASRRAVIDVFRTLGGERGLTVSGVFDVNGVRLQIDDHTVDQLMLDLAVSPIVRPSTSSAAAGAGDPRDLRATLRAVAAEREDLDRAIDGERERLDPFASAALDAAIGRVDALESQRISLRAEHERLVARQRREDDQRSARRAGVVWIEAVLAAVDVAALRSAIEDLSRPVDVSSLAAPRAAAEAECVVAASSLAAAEAALDAALATGEQPSADPDLVRRLEAVRDEIFAGDDRTGLGRVVRDKRRLSELRAEEAVLLDSLGFDTYSDYVMGVPSSTAAPAASAARVDELRHAVAEARDLVERRRVAADDLDREIAQIGAEHLTSVADVVAEAVEPARPAPGDGTWVSDRWPDSVGAPPAPPPAVSVDDPEVMCSGVQRWLDWHAATFAWAATADASLDDASPVGSDSEDARRAWAALELEVDAALDLLGTAQDRVRLHESASDAIAELRERQLLLRDRERDLLERIAADAGSAGSAGSSGTSSTGYQDTTVSIGGPTEEWRVIETLAQLRAASFVGAVPVLVDGIVDDPEQRRAVLDRLDEMSDLIQVVVLTDDRSVADLASSYGDRAAVI